MGRGIVGEGVKEMGVGDGVWVRGGGGGRFWDFWLEFGERNMISL